MIFIFSYMSISLSAQSKPFNKQILAGYEINYFGKNSFIHSRLLKNNHIIEMGINYNFSDGFCLLYSAPKDVSHFFELII